MTKISIQSIKPILGQQAFEYEQSALSTIDAWVATVVDTSVLSRLVGSIVSRYPYSDLQHVKRVRKTPPTQIDIFIVIYDDDPDFGASWRDKLDDDFVNVLDNVRIEKVPKLAPRRIEIAQQLKLIWPVTFHNGAHRQAKTLDFIENDARLAEWVFIVLEEAERARRLGNVPIGCVVLDEKLKFVARGHDQRTREEAESSICQPSRESLELLSKYASCFKTEDNKCTESLFDCSILEHAALKCINLVSERDLKCGEKRKDPNASYLLTGYTAILSSEPCLYCSMALLHSRIKHVLYIGPSVGSGALGGRWRIHGHHGLNHTFSVSMIQLNE